MRFRVSLGVSFALGLVLCSVPLLGVLGLESALLLGIVLPTLCAVIGARLGSSAQQATSPPSTGALIGMSVGAALRLLAVPIVLLSLNALRVRNCEPLQGIAFIALGPLFGCVLAAFWGLVAGCVVRSQRLAIALALLGPLGEIGLSLYGLYATPAVFSYGYFFGYFPGSLYDELVSIPWQLILLRISTAFAIVALLCLLLSHREPATGRLQLRPLPGAMSLSALAVLGATLVVIAHSQRVAFSQATSRAHIIEQLGASYASKRCDLHVPAEMRKDDRERLGADCDFRVRQMERFFGVTQRERIAVLAFRNANEKKQLMGAGQTNIAKPWRREIYIEAGDWPHSILAHELAHIVVGNVGMGPMRITGKLFGLIPDMALVEGVAVAAAWSSSAPSGLNPHQWTAAMLELGIAPRLHDVVGTGFLGQQKRLAYTYVGSLVRFIADTHGSKAVRAFYQTGDIASAVGMSLHALEQQWHAYVKQVPFPDAARALAAQRFSGGSVLSSVCPHTRAALKQDLAGALAAADDSSAREMCTQVLDIDPTDAGTRATLVGLLGRAGASREALAQLAQLEQSDPNAAVIAAARQLLADEDFRRGNFDLAQRAYRELLRAPQERDSLRLLQVKSLALEGSPRQRQLLFDILIGEPGRSTDGASAVYFARELRAERSDGLPMYLEARQLYFQKRFIESEQLSAQALALGLPTAELSAEGLRMQAMAAFASGELGRSRELFSALAQQPASLGYELEARDWLERIAFTR
jgi:tetratricopeptide (TPR) repeat protein